MLREEHTSLNQAFQKIQASSEENERRSQELKEGAARFTSEARQAIEEARQNIRIMVTAPKVSINVGGNAMDLTAPFPFSAIKQAVSNEVIPKFSRVFTVGEQVGDAEIRHDVQDMVQQLALTLQTRVHELMPQAEGTCNWDGFGAKCGTVGKG